jgi:hypothetical protein
MHLGSFNINRRPAGTFEDVKLAVVLRAQGLIYTDRFSRTIVSRLRWQKRGSWPDPNFS